MFSDQLVVTTVALLAAACCFGQAAKLNSGKQDIRIWIHMTFDGLIGVRSLLLCVMVAAHEACK